MAEDKEKLPSANKAVFEFDQFTELFNRTLPGALKAMYNELVKEGFTKPEAFELIKEYLKILMGSR